MGRAGILVRFVIAALVLVVLLVVLGPRRILDLLADFRPVEAGGVILLGTVWLALRAEGMYQTVRVSLPGTTRSTCARAFLSGVFVASVLPVGNVGGVVSAAYVLSDRADTTGAGAVGILSAWEVLNMIASVSIAFVGVTVVLLPGGRIDPWILTAVGIAGAIGLVTALLVRFRRPWITIISWYAARTLHRLVSRVAPSRADQFAPTILAARGRRFAAGFTALTGDRQALVRTVAVLMVAWSALGAALLVSFVAMGASIPVGVALLVPQVAGLAGLVPLPGGLGSIDATLVALLVSLTATRIETVGASVLVFRVATYWWGLILSSLVVVGLGIRIRGFE